MPGLPLAPFGPLPLPSHSPSLRRPALQLVNYGVRNWADGWRLSLGLAAVPALILLAGGILLPESPNSLIER